MKRNLLLKSVALKIRRQTTKAKLENSLAVRPKDRACPSRSDIFFVVVAMLLVTGNLVFGQQWVGPNTATSPIYRIGKVGIGATNPRNPLAIRGTGLYQDLISFEDPFGITKFHLTLNVGGNNPGLNFAETNVADARLFIRAGGNIGIGTATPQAKLDIVGPTPYQFRLQGTGSSNNWLIFHNANAANDFGLTFTDRNGTYLKLDDRGTSSFPTGPLGIGTTNPKSKLHVVGDIVAGKDVNGQKFIFHTRTQANGDFLQ